MKVSTPEQMRRLDRSAIRQYHIPDLILMENAGLAAFRVIMDRYGCKNLRAAILCGSGNNGGDGLVLARHMHSHGGHPSLVLLGDPEKYAGAAKRNFEIISGLPIPVASVKNRQALQDLLAHADLIVDAIFGTGLDRSVEGFYREAICTANDSGLPIIALDIPSGVSGLSGQVLGEAISAEATITFGLPKRGNLFYPGAGLCGDLFVTHIGFPRELVLDPDIKVEASIPPPLPPRRADGYKTAFGDALFIAGSRGYYGAPVFAALSHLKAGGGYARLATPRSLAPHLAANGSEIVFLPQEETGEGSLSLSAQSTLIELSVRSDFIVIGPGLSLQDETQALVWELTRHVQRPILIDGDGLTALCREDEYLAGRKHPTIMTPHLGEMARLSGKNILEIQDNPVNVLRDECAKRHAIIVLKGAHSLIGMPDGRVHINLSGNSGMATAGSGDVLTGCISAMYGLGLPVEDAVTTGVFLHGLAGDLAAQDLGADGMTARDILAYLPAALFTFRDQYTQLTQNCYQKISSI